MGNFNPEQFRDEMVRMAHRRHRRRSPFFGVVLGTFIVLLGVLFLLRNLGFFYVDQLWKYWPLILIALGLSRMATSRRFSGILWSGIVAIAGGVLLLENLHLIRANIEIYLGPSLLIAGGLTILLRTAERRRQWGKGGAIGPPGAAGFAGSAPLRTGTPDRLNEWAVFGGLRRRIDSQKFEGGEVNAVFGGADLDLRPAGIAADEIVVEANAIFGGVEIRVPETWSVTVSGHGFFGGWDDHTLQSAPEGTRPHVIIEGNAVFGGVTVKN